MTRLVLCQPPDSGADVIQQGAMPPLALLYLGGAVEAAGHEVEAIDGSFLRLSAMSEGEANDHIVARVIQAADASPQSVVLGLSVLFTNVANALAIAAQVRAQRPSVLIILGGHQASLLAERYIRNDAVDMVALGDGIGTLCALCDALQAGEDWQSLGGLALLGENGALLLTGQAKAPDFDAMRPPARHLLPSPRDYARAQARHYQITERAAVATVMSGYGCVYRCSFCSVPAYQATMGPWQGRSPTAVIDEIEALVATGDTDFVYLTADLFFTDRSYVDAFCEEYKRRNSPLPFGIAARAVQLARHPDLIGKLFDAGCRRIEVGIESGSPRSLRHFRKVEAPDLVAKVVALFAEHAEGGLELDHNFIMFNPWTAPSELTFNIDFMKRCGFWGGERWHLLTTRLVYIPGAELYDRRYAHLAPQDRPEFGLSTCDDPEVEAVRQAITEFVETHSAEIAHMVDQALHLAQRELGAELAGLAQGLPFMLFERLVQLWDRPGPVEQCDIAGCIQDSVNVAQRISQLLQDAATPPPATPSSQATANLHAGAR